MTVGDKIFCYKKCTSGNITKIKKHKFYTIVDVNNWNFTIITQKTHIYNI